MPLISRSLTPADLIGELSPGRTLYVHGTTGTDTNDGLSWDTAKKTLQAAVDVAQLRDTILVAIATLTEDVTIPKALTGLSIVGQHEAARPGLVATTDGVAITNEANNVRLMNLVVVGDGTGGAILNRGRRLRTYNCKIQGGAVALKLTLGSNAQITAGTHEKGDDCWFINSEIALADKGVQLVGTDYGAVTQTRFRDCTFHDNTDADFEEALGAGASAAVTYRDLDIGRCVFLRREGGAEPTAYILLNDDNGNKGVVWGSHFPTALTGGKNLVSTGLIWTGNYHTGGLSTGQPS